MSAPDDQRRRAASWRSVVATTFRSFGIDAEARMPVRRPADVFDAEPDVYLPQLGCHVVAAPIPWGRVSVYLNRAVIDADDRGAGDVPVVIRPAPADAPEAAYCVLRLADFARLAKDAAKGREGTPSHPRPAQAFQDPF